MFSKCSGVVVALLGVCVLGSMALAAPVKTYQVTGPVLEITADKIVVEKGKDKWEIARDADTKVPADLKVGDKVTIDYRMTAATVTVKPQAEAKAKKTPQS